MHFIAIMDAEQTTGYASSADSKLTEGIEGSQSITSSASTTLRTQHHVAKI